MITPAAPHIIINRALYHAVYAHHNYGMSHIWLWILHDTQRKWLVPHPQLPAQS